MHDTNNQQERQQDLAWLAGLWEGEGCFSLFSAGGGRIYAGASLPNTDFVLIEAIHAALRRCEIGHYIHTRKLSVKNPKHKDNKTIYVCGQRRAAKLIDSLLPYMRGKKQEVARVVRAYIARRLSLPRNSGYTQADRDFVSQVRALNRKGPVESSETIRLAPAMLDEDIVQAV